MEIQEIYERSKLNAVTFRLISFTLVTLMMTCAATTVVSFVSQVIKDYQPYYLILLCFLVALDRLYSYRYFRNWMLLSREWLILFGSHLIVVVVFSKVAVGLSHGLGAFLKEIPTWADNFPSSFVSYETGFALILAFATWLICGSFAEMLEEIGPDQIQNTRLDLVNQDQKYNVPIRQRLIALFFWLGTFLVIFTMIGRVNQRMDFVHNNYDPTIQVPILAMGGASTLLYFMLGLALLSQTQFISLHIRWNIQRIPVNGRLAKQWAGYSLLFLGLIVFVVSMLPTSYGIQPLSILGYGINYLFYLLALLGQWLLQGVMSLLDRVFGRQAFKPPVSPPVSAIPTPPPGSDVPLGGGAIDWAIVQTVIFWVVFAAVIFFGIRQYLLQNQELVEKLRSFSGWRWLMPFWDWLKSLLTQAKNTIETAVSLARERLHLDIPRRGFGNGFINLRKLDPRQRVYFFYLAFIRRAGETGLPRSSAQTPEEYAATLQSALPESTTDIRALTEAFSAARYSRQPVETEQSQKVESIWARVRKALRDRRAADL